MQVILARTAAHAQRLACLHPAALVVDHTRNTLWRGETAVRFEPSKFQIVLSVVRHLGGIISKPEIFDEIWGDDPDGGPDAQEKIIDVHLCKIRKVLPSLGIAIETVHGRGYCLADIAVPAQVELRRAA